jgi:hypothetical protein
MSNRELKEEEYILSYYGEMLKILSTCSIGKSHTAEAVCQRLVPLQTLLTAIHGTLHLPLLSALTG